MTYHPESTCCSRVLSILFGFISIFGCHITILRRILFFPPNPGSYTVMTGYHDNTVESWPPVRSETDLSTQDTLMKNNYKKTDHTLKKKVILSYTSLNSLTSPLPTPNVFLGDVPIPYIQRSEQIKIIQKNQQKLQKLAKNGSTFPQNQSIFNHDDFSPQPGQLTQSYHTPYKWQRKGMLLASPEQVKEEVERNGEIMKNHSKKCPGLGRDGLEGGLEGGLDNDNNSAQILPNDIESQTKPTILAEPKFKTAPIPTHKTPPTVPLIFIAYPLVSQQIEDVFMLSFEEQQDYIINPSRINTRAKELQLELNTNPDGNYSNINPLHLLEIQYSETTIFFSHGNAADIGNLYEWCLGLSRNFQCNICLYDYMGYGGSQGLNRNPENLLKSGENALLFMLDIFRDRTKNVILYGQSIGSTVTCHLGYKFSNIDLIDPDQVKLSNLGTKTPKNNTKLHVHNQPGTIELQDLILDGSDGNNERQTRDNQCGIAYMEKYNTCQVPFTPAQRNQWLTQFRYRLPPKKSLTLQKAIQITQKNTTKSINTNKTTTSINSTSHTPRELTNIQFETPFPKYQPYLFLEYRLPQSTRHLLTQYSSQCTHNTNETSPKAGFPGLHLPSNIDKTQFRFQQNKLTTLLYNLSYNDVIIPHYFNTHRATIPNYVYNDQNGCNYWDNCDSSPKHHLIDSNHTTNDLKILALPFNNSSNPATSTKSLNLTIESPNKEEISENPTHPHLGHRPRSKSLTSSDIEPLLTLLTSLQSYHESNMQHGSNIAHSLANITPLTISQPTTTQPTPTQPIPASNLIKPLATLPKPTILHTSPPRTFPSLPLSSLPPSLPFSLPPSSLECDFLRSAQLTQSTRFETLSYTASLSRSPSDITTDLDSLTSYESEGGEIISSTHTNPNQPTNLTLLQSPLYPVRSITSLSLVEDDFDRLTTNNIPEDEHFGSDFDGGVNNHNHNNNNNHHHNHHSDNSLFDTNHSPHENTSQIASTQTLDTPTSTIRFGLNDGYSHGESNLFGVKLSGRDGSNNDNMNVIDELNTNLGLELPQIPHNNSETSYDYTTTTNNNNNNNNNTGGKGERGERIDRIDKVVSVSNSREQQPVSLRNKLILLRQYEIQAQLSSCCHLPQNNYGRYQNNNNNNNLQNNNNQNNNNNNNAHNNTFYFENVKNVQSPLHLSLHNQLTDQFGNSSLELNNNDDSFKFQPQVNNELKKTLKSDKKNQNNIKPAKNTQSQTNPQKTNVNDTSVNLKCPFEDSIPITDSEIELEKLGLLWFPSLSTPYLHQTPTNQHSQANSGVCGSFHGDNDVISNFVHGGDIDGQNEQQHGDFCVEIEHTSRKDDLNYSNDIGDKHEHEFSVLISQNQPNLGQQNRKNQKNQQQKLKESNYENLSKFHDNNYYHNPSTSSRIKGIVLHSGLQSVLSCVTPSLNLHSTELSFSNTKMNLVEKTSNTNEKMCLENTENTPQYDNFDHFPTLKHKYQTIGSHNSHGMDILLNGVLVQYISAPILLLHGCQDRVVPISSAHCVYNNALFTIEPVFIHNADHNDVESCLGPVYFDSIRKFIFSCENDVFIRSIYNPAIYDVKTFIQPLHRQYWHWFQKHEFYLRKFNTFLWKHYLFEKNSYDNFIKNLRAKKQNEKLRNVHNGNNSRKSNPSTILDALFATFGSDETQFQPPQPPTTQEVWYYCCGYSSHDVGHILNTLQSLFTQQQRRRIERQQQIVIDNVAVVL